MKNVVPVGIILIIIVTSAICSADNKQLTCSSETYDLLIITPNQFTSTLQPFITHKNTLGIHTTLTTTEDIYQHYPGNDTAEQIKYCIKHALDTWNIHYVLLVGSKEHVPVRYTNICGYDGSWNYFLITDLYYADIYFPNGTFSSWDTNNDGLYAGKHMTEKTDIVDYYPDVCVGRFLCTTSTELQTIINKIITYETNNQLTTTWFPNLILCAGDDAEAKDEWRLSTFINEPCRLAWEGEYMATNIAQMLTTFIAKKLFTSGIFRPDAQRLTVHNINQAINDGAGFLLFIGHGSATNAIATNFPFCSLFRLPFPNGYPDTNINHLINQEKLPIAVFAGCNCGNFDDESPWGVNHPIAWQFVQHPTGGSIISFANTWGSNIMMSNLCTKIWTGHLILGVFDAYAQGINTAGDIWANTITQYLNDEQALTLADKICMWWWRTNHVIELSIEEWILFGDPSLKIGGYQ